MGDNLLLQHVQRVKNLDHVLVGRQDVLEARAWVAVNFLRLLECDTRAKDAVDDVDDLCLGLFGLDASCCLGQCAISLASSF